MQNPNDVLRPKTRREFIKVFALGTAASTLLGKKLNNSLLAEVTEGEPYTGVIAVKIADFPVLLSANGSVRITFSLVGGNAQPNSFPATILTRGTGATLNTFYSVESKCTHETCSLPPYSTANNNSILCLCHLRRFNRDGTYQGGPGNTGNLLRYSNTFDGTTVRIEIPGLGYSTKPSLVQSSTVSRVQLDFHSLKEAKYEVKYTPKLSDPWTRVQFSTTKEGLADKSIFIGTGSPTSLYVDRTGDLGFYRVELLHYVDWYYPSS